MEDKDTGLIFDDYAENESKDQCKHPCWTYLCEDHAVHSSPTLQETAIDGCVCGVEGCEHEAIYYYDFTPKETDEENKDSSH